jgi:RNA polymerase sigma-70 factor (ECF subfamily)
VSLSDEELMLAYQAGDRTAFEEIFERYHRRIFAYLRRHRSEPEVAEDLFQATFLRVHEARARYQPTAAFSTWLYTIATNLLRDEARRNPGGGRAAPTADVGETAAAPDRHGPEKSASRSELRARISAAVRGLPVEQREAFVLGKYEGRGYEEIGEILGCSVGAVKVRVHRAMLGLRAALAETIHDL